MDSWEAGWKILLVELVFNTGARLYRNTIIVHLIIKIISINLVWNTLKVHETYDFCSELIKNLTVNFSFV